MGVRRIDANPILTPADVEPTRDDLEIMCTLNPAAVRVGEEILLLVRVGEKAIDRPGVFSCVVYDAQADRVKINHIPLDDPDLDTIDPRKHLYRGLMLLTSMSHLRVARSTDGVNFTFDGQPAIFPTTPYEAYGCEDARITTIDGLHYIAYTAVSSNGVTVALASTEDFKSFEKHGVIFPPYNKDVAIFPEKIGGAYVCRHRPFKSVFNPAAIWTARSPDMLNWGGHEMTLAPTPGTWEAQRVGCGAPPIRTEHGWLEIYHAADEHGVYRLGAMLSDLDHPERITSRSRLPVMEPQTDYELNGVFDNVVFSNGLIAADGKLTIYYGAADTICAAAVTTVDEMVAAAKNQ